MKRWTRTLHEARGMLRASGAAVFMALIVVACGGGGDGPPDQSPATSASRDAIVGTATSGDTSGREVASGFAAKGTVGSLRTATGINGVLDFEVSLTQLTGPYALRAQIAIGDADPTPYFSVAPSRGVANITPLTTLVVAQLYGDQPSAIFNGFGAGSAIDASRITEANLLAAQERVIAFVRDEIGYTIPAGIGNFVTTPFRAVAGDPAYGAITGLAQRLAATNTTIQTLTGNLVLQSQQCLTEKIAITVGSAVIDFCPQTKTAQPRDADPTLIDYRFVDRRGNRLELAIRGDSVASVTYTTAAGAIFTCSGAGCAAVTLGTPAGDLTRAITFTRLALQGATGTALLNGTLRGAIPGIALPILPCSNNRYTMVFADRSTVGRCVDPDPFGFGLAGIPNQDLVGVEPSRARYVFSPLGGDDPTNAQLSVITDANNAVLAIQFTDADPDTGTVRRRYVCKDAACLGTITYGPSTFDDTTFGASSPFYVRTITFANATLALVDDNGTPLGETATLNSASFTTAFFPAIPPIEYPPLAACGPGEETLAAVADSAANFNACLLPGSSSPTSLEDPTTLAFDASDANGALSVRLIVRNGVVLSTLINGAAPGGFSCVGACPGITVSAPDVNGVQTLTLVNVVVNELFFTSFTTPPVTVFGPRSLTLNGVLTFTPLPP